MVEQPVVPTLSAARKQQLDAGRRRLEKFRESKNAEKGKKVSQAKAGNSNKPDSEGQLDGGLAAVSDEQSRTRLPAAESVVKSVHGELRSENGHVSDEHEVTESSSEKAESLPQRPWQHSQENGVAEKRVGNRDKRTAVLNDLHDGGMAATQSGNVDPVGSENRVSGELPFSASGLPTEKIPLPVGADAQSGFGVKRPPAPDIGLLVRAGTESRSSVKRLPNQQSGSGVKRLPTEKISLPVGAGIQACSGVNSLPTHNISHDVSLPVGTGAQSGFGVNSLPSDSIPLSIGAGVQPGAGVEKGIEQVVHSPTRKGSSMSHSYWQSASSKDDFRALEQHIEDLTQEKFSLQRGLAVANEVADQLAKEHSSLTENYNHQGKVVNQLRDDLAQQQAEIQAQALVIASLRAERQKAQRESASAIERSQTLAAEVVSLEERVLQLRSQGLKLERSMEALTAENDSHRKQVLSLEKDRANLKSMFEAVQEEKKLLTARLQQSSKSQQIASSRNPSSATLKKADACTSTDDMPPSFGTSAAGLYLGAPTEQERSEPGVSQEQRAPDHSRWSGAPVQTLQAGVTVPSPRASAVATSEVLNLRALSSFPLPPLSATIPDSQVKCIESIDSLIVELADDKAALIRALNAESASAAELRSANMELQQKLEAQTQRLELVIAQSIAARDGSSVFRQHQEEVASAGEGEGVLGWIKWLIPSRKSPPTRRRYRLL